MNNTKKRDALVTMYTYAQEYLKQRIDIVNDEDLVAEYKRELKETEKLFKELFEKAHNGTL